MHPSLWSWPQWIYVGLLAFILVSTAILHGGQKKPKKHDFFETAFWLIPMLALFWWGGFFP